ncbi:MAG: hypothetical protein M3Q50_06550 [Chloroflexota bacterium]|nr:hypothetical protein [Chloroflexota bacterium]
MATVPSFLSMPLPRVLVGQAWRRNRPLVVLVLGMLAVLAIALIGLVIDPRVITGAPAWLKPAKFAISIAVYGATLLWLLTFLSDRPRLVMAVSWGVAITLGVEMVLIVMQAARGVTSHFNQTTAFDAAVFSVMGASISALWLLTALVAIVLMRRRFAVGPIVWGVRIGLIAGLIGMAVAFLMVRPTPEQETLATTMGSSAPNGAHAIGVADGGPGLPVVGWSTEGGDLRAPHFIGLHALQVLSLLGIALVRYAPEWLSMRDRSQLVGIAGISWIALTLLLTWQALRGQSIIAPDGVTLMALGALLGTATLGLTSVILRARTHAH